MRRTFSGILLAGDPLIHQALEANRRYREAEETQKSAEEIERLRLLAESLYQAVTDYQLLIHKQLDETVH